MKGVFSFESQSIVSYGTVYDTMEGESIVDIPDDFEFGKYNYTPNEDGTFNVDGFVLISLDDNQ